MVHVLLIACQTLPPSQPVHACLIDRWEYRCGTEGADRGLSVGETCHVVSAGSANDLGLLRNRTVDGHGQLELSF